jgi:hypothetical protein
MNSLPSSIHKNIHMKNSLIGNTSNGCSNNAKKTINNFTSMTNNSMFKKYQQKVKNNIPCHHHNSVNIPLASNPNYSKIGNKENI